MLEDLRTERIQLVCYSIAAIEEIQVDLIQSVSAGGNEPLVNVQLAATVAVPKE